MDEIYALSPRATVFPYIPVSLDSLLLAQAADLGRCDAFIVAVVPLANVFGDFDAGIACLAFLRYRPVPLPRKRVGDTQVQQLKGALCSLARRDVTVVRRAWH